jgi:hypothetical protein
MASLRKAAQCIGLAGQFSVVRDFFGHITGTPQPLSLLTQVRLLQGKHIHVNLIRTHHLTAALFKQIDQGLFTMRSIYAAVNIGVGRVKHYKVPAGGYEIIVDDEIAIDLFGSYSGPGDGIDMFLALTIVGIDAGGSPTDGSCDKDDKDSGLVIGVMDSGSMIGNVFAHEVGHYLGLDHVSNSDNLMYQFADGGTGLSGGQAGAMKLHCSMRSGCPT